MGPCDCRGPLCNAQHAQTIAMPLFVGLFRQHAAVITI